MLLVVSYKELHYTGQQGSDVYCMNITWLFVSFYRQGHLPMVVLLMRYRANPYLKDTEGIKYHI